MYVLRAYVIKPFYEIFYKKTKKIINFFLTAFSIFNKKVLKLMIILHSNDLH